MPGGRPSVTDKWFDAGGRCVLCRENVRVYTSSRERQRHFLNTHKHIIQPEGPEHAGTEGGWDEHGHHDNPSEQEGVVIEEDSNDGGGPDDSASDASEDSYKSAADEFSDWEDEWDAEWDEALRKNLDIDDADSASDATEDDADLVSHYKAHMDDPVHPGAQVTTREMVYFLLMYKTQHHLGKAAIDQLCRCPTYFLNVLECFWQKHVYICLQQH